MAALSLPEDVVAHLQAAIRLTNRRVHFHLLDEAERLIGLNLPNAAILITGAVLESFFEEVSLGRVIGNEMQVAQWRGLRNCVAHSGSPQPTVDQATEMIRGVRGLLTWDLQVAADVRPGQKFAQTPRQVRGKYKFVPTSSTAFIERKADHVRLEH